VQRPQLCPLSYGTGSCACLEELPTTHNCLPPDQRGPAQDDSVERSDEGAEKAAPMQQQQQIRPSHQAEEQPAQRHLICADRIGRCHFCLPL